MNDPIEKTLTVPLSPAEAFALFTVDIDTWWPKSSHSVTGANAKLTFATHKDGKITEESDDGTVTVWGIVIACDPGKYLAFSWFPGRPESEATVVTVTFTETAEGTRCDLTHGGFEILGDTADGRQYQLSIGLGMVLGCYASAAKTPAMA